MLPEMNNKDKERRKLKKADRPSGGAGEGSTWCGLYRWQNAKGGKRIF